MKVYTLQNLLTALAITCIIPMVNAQFDDVYYNPDDVDQGSGYGTGNSYVSDQDVTYYDDDEYEYYDDYEYYYSSRIRRFHRPYSGFDFYDPYYVNYSYYDPFYSDAYYYPGASIYISFGNADYWGYRNWRRWNRWNQWNSYNSWCLTPSAYYYSYNNWCSPSYHYWDHQGYYSYSNYYNNYYNSCPLPISNYNGITHSTVTTINNGNTRGSYYGPRITGNTGSSPRGTITKPEAIQPVMKGTNDGLTDSNDKPREAGSGVRPGNASPILPGDDRNIPGQISEGTPSKSKDSDAIVREIPVDKELKRDEVSPSTGRPIFRPYPTNERPSSSSNQPAAEKPSYQPTPHSRTTPKEADQSPQYQPSPRNSTERPAYTPPSRSEDKPSYTPRNDNRPSYSPPSRNHERSGDLPKYTPPQRSNEKSDDKPSYSPPQRNNDSGKSNDRSSYSPPSRNESSSSARSSSPPPQRRDSSPSRSNSSSGGSPRSPGRG